MSLSETYTFQPSQEFWNVGSEKPEIAKICLLSPAQPSSDADADADADAGVCRFHQVQGSFVSLQLSFVLFIFLFFATPYFPIHSSSHSPSPTSRCSSPMESSCRRSSRCSWTPTAISRRAVLRRISIGILSIRVSTTTTPLILVLVLVLVLSRSLPVRCTLLALLLCRRAPPSRGS